MEEYKFLQYTCDASLATITINRPPHNVLDIALMEELNRALDIAAREESAKLLMITAAGEKVYPLAAQTLDRQLALREDLQSLVGGRKTLRLEVSFAIGEHLLPELLLRFAERFPKYKINSRLGYSRQIQTPSNTKKIKKKNP